MVSRIPNGLWWSNATYSSVLAHYLYTGTTSIIPQNNDYRGTGIAIRCVTREE